MLIVANRKNLKIHAKALLGIERGEPETEKALIREALRKPEYRRGEHPSHAERAHLSRLDKILGTYGVEGILEWKAGGNVDCTNYDESEVIDIQYCNAGDSYAMTLLYWRGKLRIGDWGSIVENCQ